MRFEIGSDGLRKARRTLLTSVTVGAFALAGGVGCQSSNSGGSVNDRSNPMAEGDLHSSGGGGAMPDSNMGGGTPGSNAGVTGGGAAGPAGNAGIAGTTGGGLVREAARPSAQPAPESRVAAAAQPARNHRRRQQRRRGDRARLRPRHGPTR